MRQLRLMVGIAALALAGLTGTAVAQTGPYPPAGGCSLGLSSSSVAQGGQTTVSTIGCTSTNGYTGTVALEINPPLGTVTAVNGGFSTTVTIPSSVSPGGHTITATGPGAAGGTLVLSAAVTVTAPGAAPAAGAAEPVPGTIAFTGSNTWPAFWIGLTAIVVGMIMILAVRRRARVRLHSSA